MNTSKFLSRAVLVLATATLTLPADASSNDRRTPSSRRRARGRKRPTVIPDNAARVNLCMREVSTGAGIGVLPVPSNVAETLLANSAPRYALVGEEVCDDGWDNDCDGMVDEDCASTTCGNGILDDTEECDDGNQDNFDTCSNDCTHRSICGNGIVEGFEDCDDGNLQSGDGCSQHCEVEDQDGSPSENPGTEPEPEPEPQAPPIWAADPACDACMSDRCDEQNEACLSDSACLEAAQCHLEARCLDPFLGPLACLCGDSVTVSECQAAEAFAGPCAEVIQTGLGTETDMPRTFSRFADPRTAVGRAHQAFICMGRSCKDECSENITFGGREPKPKPDPEPVVEMEWYAGQDCATCMAGECGAPQTRCAKDPECVEAAQCHLENRCLEPFLGPLSCLCGDGVTVSECQKPEPFVGPCADVIQRSLDTVGDKNRTFSNFTNPEFPVGAAHHAMICMGRFCETECAENITFRHNPVVPDPEPTLEMEWNAGQDCASCMADSCSKQQSECANDLECVNAAQCHLEAKCMDPLIGPLSCLCGDGISVTECIESEGFAGPCAEEIQLGLNAVGDKQRTFSRFSNPDFPVGAAHRAFICMGRFCSTQCEENIQFRLPELPQPAPEPEPQPEPEPGPPTFEWGSDLASCDRCMDQKCAEIEAKCFADSACVEAKVCHTESKCLDKFLGPLPCLCGIGVTPEACVNAETFKGPCADAIQNGLGTMGNTQRTFELFPNPETPMGMAHQGLICMGRFCREECTDLIYND